MDTHSLASWIESRPTTRPDDWLLRMDDRKQEEAAFHDADRTGHRDESASSTPNRRFYQSATVVRDYVDNWMRREVPGRTFLDYACGNGANAIVAAEAGASLAVGIDISAVSVKNAAENAERAGVGEKARFLQADCENTELPDAAFDRVLCSGMLHHLDLNVAYPELERVLRPNGRILCVEALSYNPVIQLYRNRTPELRTAWEKDHILSMKEVRQAEKWFDVENVRFFLLAAPLATFLPAGRIRNVGLSIGHAVDAVLTRLPLVQMWSWTFTFELVKRNHRA